MLREEEAKDEASMEVKVPIERFVLVWDEDRKMQLYERQGVRSEFFAVRG